MTTSGEIDILLKKNIFNIYSIHIIMMISTDYMSLRIQVCPK